MLLADAPTRRVPPVLPQTRLVAIRRLAVSRLVSAVGTDATGVAIGFVLYAQTGSAAWLSASLMVTIGVGALLAPWAGKLGDVLDRRRLMIGTELAAAVVFLALALMHSPVALLGLGLLAATIGTIFGPASGAALAHVAGNEDLARASSAIAMAASLGKTGGRLLAGALIALVGATSVFVLDALTFLASAWLIASVRRPFSAARAAAPTNDAAPTDLVAVGGGLRGMAAVVRRPVVGPLVSTACVSTFATAFTLTAEVPLAFELGAGPLGLGVLTAGWGAGMVAGAWTAGRLLHAGNEATGVLAGRLLMALGVGLVAVWPSLGGAVACYLVAGSGAGFMGVATQSLLLRRVADHLRARTLAAVEALRSLAFGAGVLGAGALVGLLGPHPVYAAVGVTLALGTIPTGALVLRLGGLASLRPA